MKIDVKVIPGAKKNLLKKEGPLIKVYLSAPAIEGKANKALVEFLADQFHVAQRDIEITKGLKSRHKTINIKPLSDQGRQEALSRLE